MHIGRQKAHRDVPSLKHNQLSTMSKGCIQRLQGLQPKDSRTIRLGTTPPRPDRSLALCGIPVVITVQFTPHIRGSSAAEAKAAEAKARK